MALARIVRHHRDTRKMESTMASIAKPLIEGVTNETAFCDLLYQTLETELGGVEVYTAAVKAAVNDDLRKELTKYLKQTKRHVTIARDLLQTAGLDPDADCPARSPVRRNGEALVEGIENALGGGDPIQAELVAIEAVCLAETKDHGNWELLKELSKRATGDIGKMLRYAVEQVEGEEDEHLYHSKGWARELWLAAMGLPSVLPPPEETHHVETAIGAARAKHARGPAARKHDD
jgi:rubrerythrin